MVPGALGLESVMELCTRLTSFLELLVSDLDCSYVQSRKESPVRPFSFSSPKLQELLE